MKVKDLIKELLRYPEDTLIYLEMGGEYKWPAEKIYDEWIGESDEAQMVIVISDGVE